MEKKITVYNFDHVYENEHFYRKQAYQWVDMTDLSGVNGYLDDIAMEEIRRRMKKIERSYFNYIDSGNYHYMTYLLLEQVTQPFTLVLFDHHTDMMPSRFGNLLSCGCWVKRALDENPYLQEVILIGVEDHLLETIEDKYKKRIYTYTQSQVEENNDWEEFAVNHIHHPVYISVDKDVMDKRYAFTNWDQGSLTLQQLSEVLHKIHAKEKIIGVDVCGEGRADTVLPESFLINDRTNEEILHMI